MRSALLTKEKNISASFEAAPAFAILDSAVARFPDRPAIDFENTRLTYVELGALVAKIAAGLQKLGIGKGIKVGLFLPNSLHTIAFHQGILKTGATVVNYNPLYAERELVSQIEDSETDFLVTLDAKELLEKAEKILETTRLKRLIVCPCTSAQVSAKTHISYDEIINNDGRFSPPDIDPCEDVAVLQYTGGTTGIPKGAMLTHANLYINTAQTARLFENTAEPGQERQIGALPLFHVFAMTIVMNMSMWFGMEITIISKFDPEKTIPLLKRKKPTFFPAVPAIYNAIANHPASADLDLSSIKFGMSGGAPLPGDIKRLFEEKTGARIGEAYGLTESSPVVTCNPPEAIKHGSIGKPLPGTVVEILSIDDGKTVLSCGKEGEICVSGPQIMKGYYKKPEATAETIRNGRLHTGDIGYIDEEGYVYLVDRLKDMVLVRGYNVYPRQVEEAIYLHPAVEECIVAGVPDAERGETVWAWVKPQAGKSLTDKELTEFLQDKISPIEIPRKIFIRDSALPKTAVGKLSRKLLLEQEGITRPERKH